MAATQTEMQAALRGLLHDADRAKAQIETGLQAIGRSHTCRHRAHELLTIVDELGTRPNRSPVANMEQAPA